MIVPPDLPAWLKIATAIFVLTGATMTLIGSFGLLRLQNFYSRVHAPTLGTTAGMTFILVGSVLYFSVLQTRPIVHEILIVLFVTVTTPVTLMLLARAALYRDRSEGSTEVPADSPLPKSGTPSE